MARQFLTRLAIKEALIIPSSITMVSGVPLAHLHGNNEDVSQATLLQICKHDARSLLSPTRTQTRHDTHTYVFLSEPKKSTI